MNIAARLNLQRGKVENRAFEQTNYSVEEPLDAYIVQKQRMKDNHDKQHKSEQQQEALEKYIGKTVDEKLSDCLNKTFK